MQSWRSLSTRSRALTVTTAVFLAGAVGFAVAGSPACCSVGSESWLADARMGDSLTGPRSIDARASRSEAVVRDPLPVAPAAPSAEPTPSEQQSEPTPTAPAAEPTAPPAPPVPPAPPAPPAPPEPPTPQADDCGACPGDPPADEPDPNPPATDDPPTTPPPTGGPTTVDVADRAGPDTTGVTTTGLREVPAGVLDESGLVLENAVVRGDLTLTGNNQTLRNVRVEGMLWIRGSHTLVESSEAGSLQVMVTGSTSIQDVTVRDVEIFGLTGSDGLYVASNDTASISDVVFDNVWIHSPKLTSTSHYDGIQVRGVRGLEIRNSFFDLGAPTPGVNAAIFFQDVHGGNSDVVIADNWISGGGYALYLFATPMQVTDNVFVRDSAFGLVYPFRGKSGQYQFTQQGNVWADTGAPATLDGGR